MLIAGIQKNSLVDYRGKVAAVVFAPYCNLNCFYCHNRMLLERNPEKAKYTLYDNDEFFTFLEKRKGLLHGVVITGGEPTLHKDLADFIMKVREIGFPVKLDTNGYKPEVISELLEKGLLDSIAMDIKGPAEKYDEICGVSIDMERIHKSISIIMNSGIEYEFRTTVTPGFAIEDIKEISLMIKGAKRFVLQQFRKPENTLDFADVRNMQQPRGRAFFQMAKTICEENIADVSTRGAQI